MRQFLYVVIFASLLCGQGTKEPKRPNQATKTATVWTNEPDGFKGVKFGSKQSDAGFISEHECFHDGHFEDKCLQPDAQRCSFREDLGTEHCERIVTLGAVGTTLTFSYRDDKLVEVFGDFESSNYRDIREIFIGAYGKPHQIDRTTVRTSVGATFPDETLYWGGKKAEITLSEHIGEITNGSFMLSLKSEVIEKVRLKQQAKQKAIDSVKQ